jgi:hypothetical protein
MFPFGTVRRAISCAKRVKMADFGESVKRVRLCAGPISISLDVQARSKHATGIAMKPDLRTEAGLSLYSGGSMKRKTQRRTSRWSDRTVQTEVVSPYTNEKPSPREPRTLDRISGPGPYEASYDIALGYGHDRSIILP